MLNVRQLERDFVNSVRACSDTIGPHAGITTGSGEKWPRAIFLLPEGVCFYVVSYADIWLTS